MKPVLLLGFAVTALLAAAVVPACSNPGEEEAVDEASGQEAYTTDGLCDGLPRAKNLKTPAGVCVGVVTTGITFARGIAQLATGDLVVAEMGGWAKDRGGVWLLRRNADKTFSKTKINAGIDKPSAIAVGPDQLVYVGTPDAIYRFDPYAAPLKSDPTRKLAKTGPLAGPDAYKQPPLKLVVKNLPGELKPDGTSGARHPLKRFVFDKRDPWTMYVNIGSASDTCEQGAGARPPQGYPFPCAEAEGASARGAIRKYVLEGPDHLATTFTTIARGLRNSMALAVHPTSNILLQGENSRDAINKLDASLTIRRAISRTRSSTSSRRARTTAGPTASTTVRPTPSTAAASTAGTTRTRRCSCPATSRRSACSSTPVRCSRRRTRTSSSSRSTAIASTVIA